MSGTLRALMQQGADRARVYDVVARAQRMGERRRRRGQAVAAGLSLVAVAAVATAASLVFGRPDSAAPFTAATTAARSPSGLAVEQTIPRHVIDLPQDQAKATLEGLGFVVTFERVDSAEPVGAIVRTEPAAGQTIPGGSPVTVFISKGNFRTVPDLTGVTEDEARLLLQYYGFTAEPDVLYVLTTDPTHIGKVVDQTPVAQGEADPSRPFRIVVGKAPPTAPPTA